MTNEGNDSTNNGAITPSVSLEALMQAVSNISAARSDAPPTSYEDQFEEQVGSNYTPYRMPKNIRSALVANKVEAGRTPIISWCKPGDYTKTEKVYGMVGGNPQEVLATDIMGVLLDCEIRPTREGNHKEPPASSVVGVCKDGKCMKRLPSMRTGIATTLYEFAEREDMRNTAPSKKLTSMKWKPVVMPEGVLLEDLIRSGRSTATITNKEGKPEDVAYKVRGMVYMYVTQIGVRVALPSEKDGTPKINKMMNREETLANLVTTETRVDGKVLRSYSTLKVYSIRELMDEEGNPLEPFFLALNMSPSAMRSNYKGGLAGIDKYVDAISTSKGLKAPLDRTLSEDEVKMLKALNDTKLYLDPTFRTTCVSLGMKEVQTGTWYSVPHFTGYDILGIPIYDGKQHDTWGDKSGINSLKVDYLSPTLAARLKYDPSTSTALGKWENALQEAGFDSTPEEFTLASLAPKGGDTDYTDVSFTPISSPRPGYAGKTSVSDSEYFAEEVTYDEVEADDPFA